MGAFFDDTLFLINFMHDQTTIACCTCILKAESESSIVGYFTFWHEKIYSFWLWVTRNVEISTLVAPGFLYPWAAASGEMGCHLSNGLVPQPKGLLQPHSKVKMMQAFRHLKQAASLVFLFLLAVISQFLRPPVHFWCLISFFGVPGKIKK